MLMRAAACLLCLCLAACSLVAPKFNRPNVSVVSIEMRSGNLLQQNFAVKLNIQNPNNQALPVKGLHVELNVGGAQIASGVSDQAVVVPAFGESEFDLTIRANMALALIELADKMDQHAERSTTTSRVPQASICLFCAICRFIRRELLAQGTAIGEGGRVRRSNDFEKVSIATERVSSRLR